MAEPRRDLLAIFHAALQAVEGRARIADALADASLPPGPVRVLGVGKAAAAMTRGAFDVLGARIDAALVVTKHGYAQGLDGLPVTLYEAGHPVPDAASLQAGAAVLDFVADTLTKTPLIVLVSGGTSSLLEQLPAGVTLDDLHQVNQWLLASGLDIRAVNQIRKQLSCIKGGRLAQRLGGRRCWALLISDVPGDDPATIGSGPLSPNGEALEMPPLPYWLQALLEKAPPRPMPGDACFDTVTTQVIASAATARRAAAARARALGYVTYEHKRLVTGEAADQGRRLVAHLDHAAAGVHCWAGETTVQLTSSPGRGGRNQHLALAAAEAIAGSDDLWFLAAGTDGSDGPTEDAGALVDGGTIHRGERDGLNAQACLAGADSGTFLNASGDLIHTGPTGTNVMDLAIGLKC